MSSRITLPDVGCVVEIVRGRDRGLLAVVIGHEADRFVWIADGHRRKAEKPKKKNAMHIRSTSFVAADVAKDLARLGYVTNARLHNILKQAQLAMGRSVDEMHEGGIVDGQG